jgi:hypothetical protein
MADLSTLRGARGRDYCPESSTCTRQLLERHFYIPIAHVSKLAMHGHDVNLCAGAASGVLAMETM